MTNHHNPFHQGELEAQRRANVGDVASWAGGFIRDHMPDQHRAFFTALPFLVVAGGDSAGRPWVTLLEGREGFIRSPDRHSLKVDANLHHQDPLHDTFAPGSSVGMLGIELSTRRRNRLNGIVTSSGKTLAIDVRQSFGNCPQYIQEREWSREPLYDIPKAQVSRQLDARQKAMVSTADTFFIGTGSFGANGQPSSNGYDASHRGGPSGFVRVTADGTLLIPDYAGNKYFNTIGNLLRDPRVGLVFVEFETGRLLHITGRARIDWAPVGSHDPNARRMIEVTVDEVIDRPAALALRWRRDDGAQRRLKVVDKVQESDGITSFHLASVDGSALAPFKAGQFLPLDLKVPGEADVVARTYSLSGAPDAATYRISVKREHLGVASNHLASDVHIGATIETRPPSGDFVIPDDVSPLVLVSVGVGITPMLSMLHASAAIGSDRPVWFVHGARNGREHAFGREVDRLVASRPNIMRRVFYSAPLPTDTKGETFDAVGRLGADDLINLDAGPDAHYMLCGPEHFLSAVRTDLEQAGVSQDHIHVEAFGPVG